MRQITPEEVKELLSGYFNEGGLTFKVIAEEINKRVYGALFEVICGAEKDGFRCTLEPDHKGDHMNIHSSGGRVGWRNIHDIYFCKNCGHTSVAHAGGEVLCVVDGCGCGNLVRDTSRD